jgi:acyl carrier protein phosphodiesterase
VNFLAHVVLSDGTPDGMIGALLADFVRGRDLSRFPPGVGAGLRQHPRGA